MTDPTLDHRFLEELVRRADTGANDIIEGTQIAETLGETRETAEVLVARLINRGLVERTASPARGGDTYADYDIRPTPEAYRIVGHGLHG